MRGDRILTNARQFEAVYGQGRSWSSGPVVLKAMPNGLDCSRYGFSVSRRVGNAVTRNRVKRRLREILRVRRLVPGWDCVFVARASAAGSSFAALEESAIRALRRAGLLDPAGDGGGVSGVAGEGAPAV
jgi:ribonuclease P protein component